MVIAAFFRLWKLDSIPPGLYPDVAMNGNDALDTLKTGQWKLFYPENNGREGLFMWLIAFSFLIFGPSIWAIKIVAAIIGIFTVFGLYLLIKELFFQSLRNRVPFERNSVPFIAFFSSFFLAVSFWHVNFSRIGFRAILVPFILVFGFYFLFRGFRQKRVLFLIISGIFFGLGFYTYISYRFVVLLLAITLWLFYKKERQKKKFLLFAVYCLLFTVIIALPIGIYFLLNPGDFFGRAGGVSIFNSEKPFYELGKSIILHLGMFNLYGDENWRHNFSGSPQLLWPIGILFLIGLILSIKNKNYLLLSWFIIMLLPGFLSFEGIPHALRTIGAIPPVFIFAGLGAFWFFEKVKFFFKTKRQKIFFYFCFVLFLISIVFSEFDKYFYQWGKNLEVENAFSKNFVEIGNYLNSLPEDIDKYVIVNQAGVPVPWPDGLPVAAQTPIFIERVKFGKIRSTYILPKDLNKIKIDEKTVIVPLQYVQP
ncbi:MAG: hypothetical protein COU42_00010 [Candidatus Nealsonbacteria bacterium CG10_big_fil_rev_8_21_14_0_10_36_24]|uniref:Glycosyltransferase RgtA/B/C/D-like domain-containing protein n=1 Tax=Candidatus Nealsonbacteria bacterium CG10_big_fil_rev_8_21_14_0_10_36_24 TaxID=1974710 RepID=A0A2M6NSS1_9BACT|nr:MAG: hypothetical protein COU42_00010 [Candidatus Nealsonbacteria bacterium CG10_big_fil_rev_8_21_14_0_10_36_24]